MNCIVRRLLPALMLWTAVLTLVAPAQAQDASVSVRPAITVLDSTKEQDGLLGSVRRVKTETAKIEFKDGRAVEGPLQLVEVTTYGVKGNRIENTSYPIKGGLVGKEEYKYDERGNMTEMTVRDDNGAILSREAYDYEFDKFGNWTKMTTNLVVFENGELKREPTEITYRTVTYYFDDTVAKIVEAPKPPTAVKSVESAVNVTTDDTDKTDAEAQYALGFENFRTGRFEDAARAFKKAIVLEPRMAKAHYGLSLAYQGLGMDKHLLDEYRILQTLDSMLAKKLVQTFPQYDFSCRATQGCP